MRPIKKDRLGLLHGVPWKGTLVNHLPISVPANEMEEIEIKMKFHGEPGRFAHNDPFFTDLAKQPKLTGRVAGQIASLSH